MKFTISILLIVITFNCFSQSKSEKKGEQFYKESNYFAALKQFKTAFASNPKSAHLNLRIGQCYSETGKKKEAIEFITKAITLNTKADKEMNYALAKAYQRNYQFDKAAIYYKKADHTHTNAKYTAKLLKECQNGKALMAKPVKAKINNLGTSINSIYPEYLPKITADGQLLFFTSRRPGSTGEVKASDGLYHEDIYVSSYSGGRFANVKRFVPPINSEVHDAIIGLSPDGHTLFIYRGSNGGDIYISELKKKKWQKPYPLPTYINTKNFESSASLSPDGKTLYFVRAIINDKGIQGNKNIYKARRTSSGKWSKPTAIGGLNTSYDEESPFIHPDGKSLYFSSKGHSTMGGYDIFKSTKKGSSWSAPVNLGYPINSPEDDIYFVLTASGKTGYYSSARQGGKGYQDIYSIIMPVTKKHLALLKGAVKDQNGKPVCADVIITDNKLNKEVGRFSTDCETGKYLVSLPSGKNYGVAIEASGHLFHSENVYLDKNATFKVVKKNIKVKKIERGSKVVLKNIFFDTGLSALRSESKSEINRLGKLLTRNKTIKVEISGHTDNTGNYAANIKLSKDRAQAVVNYLVERGITKDRLTSKGYGPDQPIAKNDSSYGRQKNRRTEFKILSY